MQDVETRPEYSPPFVTDYGTLRELTAGCVGGIPADAMQGADVQAFPANSGVFCGP